jgi:hypothetical protein
MGGKYKDISTECELGAWTGMVWLNVGTGSVQLSVVTGSYTVNVVMNFRVT